MLSCTGLKPPDPNTGILGFCAELESLARRKKFTHHRWLNSYKYLLTFISQRIFQEVLSGTFKSRFDSAEEEGGREFQAKGSA